MIWSVPAWVLWIFAWFFWPPILGRDSVLRSRVWCTFGCHDHAFYSGICKRCGHDEFGRER